MIHGATVTPLGERWNLIRLERLYKRISILISLVKAAQGPVSCQALVVCSITDLSGLS